MTPSPTSGPALQGPSEPAVPAEFGLFRFGPPPSGVVLSVIVATYNRGARLADLLSDLQAQDAPDGHGGAWFEVVMVDDGGHEVALPFVERFVERSPLQFPFAVVRRPNGGPGQARSSGIELAVGEYVVIIDDDMRFDSSFLRAHLAEYSPTGSGPGADVVLGYIAAQSDAATLPVFERFHLDSLERFVQTVRDGTGRIDGSRLCTGNVSFRKCAYDDIGGFDLSLRRCEDRDLGLRFERSGWRLVFSLRARTEHRTDHHDVGEWRRRSRLFGELDTVIGRKHETFIAASPWNFLPMLPKVVRPFMVASAMFPALGRAVAGVPYKLAVVLDKRRPGSGLPLRLATLCYGLDYYAGVGSAHPRKHRLRTIVSSLRQFSQRRNTQPSPRSLLDGVSGV